MWEPDFLLGRQTLPVTIETSVSSGRSWAAGGRFAASAQLVASELPYFPLLLLLPRPTTKIENGSPMTCHRRKLKAGNTSLEISNCGAPIGLLDDLWPFLNLMFSLSLVGKETLRKEIQGTNWNKLGFPSGSAKDPQKHAT